MVYVDGDKVRAAKGIIKEKDNMITIESDGFVLKIPIYRIYKIV